VPLLTNFDEFNDFSAEGGTNLTKIKEFQRKLMIFRRRRHNLTKINEFQRKLMNFPPKAAPI